MKTTFKKVLSVVLALCVLLTSAVCIMGITASAAEETVTLNTKVHRVKTTGTGTTFYFSPTSSATSTGGKTGGSVRLSFDYYVTNDTTGEFVVRNNDQRTKVKNK